MSFVDAIKGFRHLLKQDDLDKALSFCTGMRGHLKSKFIVLSDDRVLPPYQGNKGKRSRPGDDDPSHASGKRQHQANYSQQSAQAVAGVSAIQYAPGLVYPGQIPQVNFIPVVGHQPQASPGLVPSADPLYVGPGPHHLASPDIQVVDQINVAGGIPLAQVVYGGAPSSVLPVVQHQFLQGPPPPSAIPVLSTATSSFHPVQVPQGLPPQMSNVTTVQAQVHGVQHGYTTVTTKTTRRRNKKKDLQSKPSRSTPTRAAKNRPESAPMEVTSPNENYESCGSSNKSVPDDEDIKQG